MHRYISVSLTRRLILLTAMFLWMSTRLILPSNPLENIPKRDSGVFYMENNKSS